MNDNDTISRKWLLEQYDAQHEGPPGRARKLIEDAPAVPHEMSAREFAEARDRLCDSMNKCTGCPIYKACLTDSLTKILPMVERSEK